MIEKEEAIKDIRIIKTAIEFSKDNGKTLRKMFLATGMLALIQLFISTIIILICDSPNLLGKYSLWVMNPCRIAYAFFLFFLIFKERNNPNVFYKGILYVWGVPSAIIPFIIISTGLLLETGIDLSDGKVYGDMYRISSFANMFLFAVACVIVGLIASNYYLLIAGAVSLFGGIIVSGYDGGMLEIHNVSHSVIDIKVFGVLQALWISFGYIAFYFILLYRSRLNGNK